MKNLVRRILLVLPLLALPAVHGQAQSSERAKPGDELYRTVAALDTALFDSFNTCDLEKFGSFFADDVEFYHDQGGVTLGRQAVTESVKKNICGGKVRRELVHESLEIYPMHGYGAVQMGVHLFHHPGRDDVEPTGEAQFMHLWQNKDGAWKITRVISYDHHVRPKAKR